jgi:glycosyltransferase involved in cell wall biosynthesis
MEIVVVNDGSQDNTSEVLDKLKPDVESRQATAVFITQDNGGVASARNAGLDAATGEWIAFLDDDDRWEPDKLALQMEVLAKTEADACSALCLVLETNGYALVPDEGVKLIDGFNPAEYIRGERHAHINSIVLRKNVAERVGKFDTDLKVAEDLEWIARLVHEARFSCVEKVLLSYNRLQPEGALTNKTSYEDQCRDHEYREKSLLKMKEQCEARTGWDESAWHHRVGLEFRRFVRFQLRHKKRREAIRLYEHGMKLSHGADPIARMGGKVRKARLKAMFGG